MGSFSALAFVALVSTIALSSAQDTGRDLLFSNPSADLPDVYISESVLHGTEGQNMFYTVTLTHPPGMRED